MRNIPIVSLMVMLTVILIIRIIYKAWRSRSENNAVRRRPDKSSGIHRTAVDANALSPLQPPPPAVAPVTAPATPAAVSSPEARVSRTAGQSIHEETVSQRVTPEGSRSRIYGAKPAGSGIWNTGYVTASGMAQHPKDEPAVELPEDLALGGGEDLFFGPVTTVLSSMLPESDERRRELTRSLQNAGYYGRGAWHNLSAIRYLGIFLPIILCGLLLVFGPPQLEPLLIGAIVFFPIVGWSVPTLLVRSRAKDRLSEISNGMPDMLDLLNMCVSQGMTVPKSIARVGNELEPVYPALAKELKIVTEQSRVGSLQQALTGFSQRVDVPEVHSFTSLIIQTDRMGTSMSDALIDYSDNMRETMRQRADERANSATFKLLFPTVLCLLPAVYLFLLGPAVIQLSDFYSGRGREVLRNETTGAGSVTGRLLER